MGDEGGRPIYPTSSLASGSDGLTREPTLEYRAGPRAGEVKGTRQRIPYLPASREPLRTGRTGEGGRGEDSRARSGRECGIRAGLQRPRLRTGGLSSASGHRGRVRLTGWCRSSGDPCGAPTGESARAQSDPARRDREGSGSQRYFSSRARTALQRLPQQRSEIPSSARRSKGTAWW